MIGAMFFQPKGRPVKPSRIDETKLASFVKRAVGDLASAYGGVMVSLGHKLGLYKALSGAGPVSAREIAARTGCAERYVREWLNAQAAGGYIGISHRPRRGVDEHDARMSCGVAAFYRNGYRASLVPQWLPALDGVVEKL
jgi:winged helix-turn-helix protein